MKYVFEYGSMPVVCTIESCKVQSTGLLDKIVDDNSFGSRGAEWNGTSLFIHNSVVGDSTKQAKCVDAALADWNNRFPDLPELRWSGSGTGGEAYAGDTTGDDGEEVMQQAHTLLMDCVSDTQAHTSNTGYGGKRRVTLQRRANKQAEQSGGIIVDGKLTSSSGGRKGTQASRFCHICLRRAEKVPMVACWRLARGSCRKVVCERCFDHFEWDWHSAIREGSQWECTHCRQTCPARAQCFIYGRTNDRRHKALLHRKAQQARQAQQQAQQAQQTQQTQQAQQTQQTQQTQQAQQTQQMTQPATRDTKQMPQTPQKEQRGGEGGEHVHYSRGGRQ